MPVRTTPSPAPAAATASPEADVQSSDAAGSGSNGDAETRALSDSDSPSIVAPVVGGAVGAVVLSIALATLALLWARRRNRSEHVPSKDSDGAAKHVQGEGQTVRISPLCVSLCSLAQPCREVPFCRQCHTTSRSSCFLRNVSADPLLL